MVVVKVWAWDGRVGVLIMGSGGGGDGAAVSSADVDTGISSIADFDIGIGPGQPSSITAVGDIGIAAEYGVAASSITADNIDTETGLDAGGAIVP